MAERVPQNWSQSAGLREDYSWVYNQRLEFLPYEVRKQLGRRLDGDTTFREFADRFGYRPLDINHFIRLGSVSDFDFSSTFALLRDYENRRGVTIGHIQAVLENMNHIAADVIPSYLPGIAQRILQQRMFDNPYPQQPPPGAPPGAQEHRESPYCNEQCNTGCQDPTCSLNMQPSHSMASSRVPASGQSYQEYVNMGPNNSSSVRTHSESQSRVCPSLSNRAPSQQGQNRSSHGPTGSRSQHLQHGSNSINYSNANPNSALNHDRHPDLTQNVQHPPNYGRPLGELPHSARFEQSGSHCEKCRLESDPHQTKLLSTYNQPDSKCAFHSNNASGKNDAFINDFGLLHLTDSDSDENPASSSNSSHSRNNSIAAVQQSSPRQMRRNVATCKGDSSTPRHRRGDLPEQCAGCTRYAANVAERDLRRSWPEDQRESRSSQDSLTLRTSSEPQDLNEKQKRKLKNNEQSEFDSAVTIYSRLSDSQYDSRNSNYVNNLDVSDGSPSQPSSPRGASAIRQNIEPVSRSTNCSEETKPRTKERDTKTDATVLPQNTSGANPNVSVSQLSVPIVPDFQNGSGFPGNSSSIANSPLTFSGVSGTRKPGVFVTFSHNSYLDSDMHPREVADLCRYLKNHGVVVKVDMDKGSFSELRLNRLDFLDTHCAQADFIIVCISPTYSEDVKEVPEGQAAARTSQLNARYIYNHIRTEFYSNHSRNRRCIPVIFSNSGATQDHVPNWLRNTLIYRYPETAANIVTAIMDLMGNDEEQDEYSMDPYNGN